MTKRLIYHYDNFSISLKPLIDNNNLLSYLFISSATFKMDKNIPYIHLNGHSFDDSYHTKLWTDCNELNNKNVKIILTIGGMNGGFNIFFNNFEEYYSILLNIINKYSFSGINIDIHEYLGNDSLNKVKLLIQRLSLDFDMKKFSIIMTSLHSSFIFDGKGLGGFSYKDLYNSNEDKYIEFYNITTLTDIESYQKIISNGYASNRIVYEMNYLLYDDNYKRIIRKLCQEFNDFGGVSLNNYNGNIDNAIEIKKIMNQYKQTYINYLYHSLF
jgi:hypothetical protein